MGIEDFFSTPREFKKWSVFPNPFTETISVLGIDEIEGLEYKIYATTGQTILYKKVNNFSEITRINLFNLPRGTYYIQIKKGFYRESHKIVKI